MLRKTLLNRVHKAKGFVYINDRFTGDRIEVEIRPRQGSRPICCGCGRRRPGYHTLEPPSFTFVPPWGIAVYLIYYSDTYYHETDYLNMRDCCHAAA